MTQKDYRINNGQRFTRYEILRIQGLSSGCQIKERQSRKALHEIHKDALQSKSDISQWEYTVVNVYVLENVIICIKQKSWKMHGEIDQNTLVAEYF